MSNRFRYLWTEFKKDTEAFNRNMVFIKIENIGEADATALELIGNYKKTTYGETQNRSLDRPYKRLKKGKSLVDIIEEYQTPNENDYFELNKCIIKFTDVKGNFNKDKKIKTDFSNFNDPIIHNTEVKVQFKST